MISIIVVARNIRATALSAVRSLFSSVARLRLESHVEYVLVDDASDAGSEISPAFLDLKSQTPSPVRVLTFAQRQHYTRALAHAFSAARGESILFVSHDMLVTPSYIRTLLAVGSLDPTIGIVRGVSPYVDCFPQHQVRSPVPPKTLDDVCEFSAFIERANGLNYVEDALLTGDSMLILPAALKSVGVFDPRYFGYFGDVDYGLRVQRAGLKLVCAKGAWLLHRGAAYYVNEAQGKDMNAIHAARMQVVGQAYRVFREKWSTALPAEYPGALEIDYAALRALPERNEGEFIERLDLGSNTGGILL